ncbi:MAG: histidinol-phosphatase [Gammaproteobacteria bacterium]|nr:histidinol-phosphatase [Gammaproteobacteria bacterium]
MLLNKNYHTHTYRCKHASQDVASYCSAAIEQGLTVLGISDHTALPDNRWSHIRMSIDELPEYIAAVDEAVGLFPQLTILKGAECEYSRDYHSFFRDELLDKHQFDYLIGAAHFFPLDDEWVGSYGGTTSLQGLQAYASYFIESMNSGLFAFMAHPDLFGNSYLQWDENTIAASRDMLSAAAELKMPMEINGYGLRKRKIDTPDGPRCMYPWLPFWELAAEYDVTVIVNSDAHHPEDVTANMAEAAAIGQQFNLKFADLSHLEP